MTFSLRIASPDCSLSSTRRPPPRSADSPSTTSKPATPTHACASDASPSCCPNRSTHWSNASSPPDEGTPPSVIREHPPGCFPAVSPDSPSPPSPRQTPSPDRYPRRTRPCHRTVPTGHRPARRSARPDARHPHRRRRRMATRRRRRLGQLRRRSQPTQPPLTKGIQTVGISDCARARRPRLRRKRSRGPRRSASSRADTDPPTRSSPSSKTSDYVEQVTGETA